MAEEQECWLLLAGGWDQSSLSSTGPGAAVSHIGRIWLCLFPFSQLPNPSTTSSSIFCQIMAKVLLVAELVKNLPAKQET